VRPPVVMLKDDSFLLRTFFTKRTTKFVERLNVASCIDPLPFFQKVDQYALPTIPKDSSHNFTGRGYCLRLLLFGGCVMAFHILSFSLWIEAVKPAFVVHLSQ